MGVACVPGVVCAVAAVAFALASDARAAPETSDSPSSTPASSAGDTVWTVLAYLPNRLFDLCDVVRLHVRVGDGLAVGARATRAVPLFVGNYSAFWLGLPGPRGRASVPVPVGLEAQKGFDLGPVSASSRARAPSYGAGEIGAGGMLLYVGADVGVDPYELADFLAGFVLVDLARDDF